MGIGMSGMHVETTSYGTSAQVSVLILIILIKGIRAVTSVTLGKSWIIFKVKKNLLIEFKAVSLQ